MDEIDEMICAELTRPGEDDRLLELVRTLNIHRHLTYCRKDGRPCHFGYGTDTTVEATFLNETINRVSYRRREQEDLRVVPYNGLLTKEFKAHINVERTNGGGTVAYLFKYAFKPPNQKFK